MQILANALPGFRDLRAPLVTGYMWLVFAWLWVEPDPDHRPANHLGASLFDLGHDVGWIWVSIAVGVVAYLAGSISIAASNELRDLALTFSGSWAISVGGQEEGLRPFISRGRTILEVAQGDLTEAQAGRLEELLERRAMAAQAEAERELDLPAILLVGDQPELFAEVDRLRSEGELRTAVSLPLIALALICGMEVSWWWLLVIPAVLILFQQGIAKDLAARTSIANAIRLGKASSAARSRFGDWVDRTFSELVQDESRMSAESVGGPGRMERLAGRLADR